MKKIILLLTMSLALYSCEDLLDPAMENNKNLDEINRTQESAMGILASAYIQMPYTYQARPQSDVATDDAVTNDAYDGYLKAATGSWSAINNPLDQWQSRRNAIQYANLFLSTVEQVEWSGDELINTMFIDRMRGEALALRALNMYFLLMAHGGYGVSGELLGVPILTEPETPESDFNRPRDTFKDCMDQIVADLDDAFALLPLDYKNHSGLSEVPQKYIDMGLANVDQYNRVSGVNMSGRMSGRIAEAIKVQALLMAASPAFAAGSGYDYFDAADCAAKALNRIGGISGIDATGAEWYKNYPENYSLGNNPPEVVWRPNITVDNALEGVCFPPTLYGTGRINPSQNLVDAFPMENGYPITDNANSGYNPADPYSGRDPRLAKYILMNESTALSSTPIVTADYGTTIDALNREAGNSTRTGYYMLKHLVSSSNPNPKYNTTKKHMCVYIRYTELFLAYAEAANEAYGPFGEATDASYSAYGVIKALRSRAGITGDAYLESIKNDDTKMRELIRNERRLELCFENHRFWDLRRWGCDLNETVRGVKITKVGGVMKYEDIDVEQRIYKSYMNYGPIPYNEMKKWSNLEQNKGW